MDVRKIIAAVVAIVMGLIQPWFFSPIYLAGLATPFPYLLVLLLLPINTKPTTMLCYGFGMGALIDVISGTPGLFAASLTFSAFTRRYLMISFLDREASTDEPPSVANLRSGFFVFLLLLVGLHLALLMLLDAFALFDVLYFLRRWFSSVVFTYIILLLLYFLLSVSRRRE